MAVSLAPQAGKAFAQMPNIRGRQTKRRGVHPTTILALTFIIPQLLFQSHLAAFLGSGFVRLCLGLSALAIVIGAFTVFVSGRLGIFALFIFMTALLVGQMYVFQMQTYAPLNWNALLQYLPVLAFAIFCTKGLQFELFFRVLFWCSLAYSLVYVLLYDQLISASLAAEDGLVPVLVSDGTRPSRLFLASGFPAFVLFYSLPRVFQKGGLPWAISALIGLMAVVSAQTRLFLVLLIFVSLLYLVGAASRFFRKVLAFIFVVVALYSVAGVLFPGAGLFNALAFDASGAARLRSASVLQFVLEQRWFQGIGIAPDRAMQVYVMGGDPYMYWEDLGPLGIWYTFGLVGLVAYIWHAVICILGAQPNEVLSKPDSHALTLLGIASGVYSILAPGIWVGGSTFVLGLILAARVANAEVLSQRAQELLRVRPSGQATPA